MKKLLFPLLLFPAFAMAQYPGNANQKITLGEQTTADGLIFRGVAADTTLTVKSDTAAYFVLDTVNLNLYTYKASASGRKWRQLGADTAAIAYVNTYGTQTVNGAKTFTSELTATRFNPTANTTTGTGMYLPATNTLGFSTNGIEKMRITSDGNVGMGVVPSAWGNTVNAFQIGNSSCIWNRSSDRLLVLVANSYFDGSGDKQINTGTSNRMYFVGGGTYFERAASTSAGSSTPWVSSMIISSSGEVLLNISDQGAYQLQVKDSVYVGGNVSASAYTTRSDYDLKDQIQNINYGINEVMQMHPVKYTYKSNGSTQLGFIAQDLGVITPEVVSFEDKMSVYYNALIPILTKAIQEQQALIKALEQRIINLENK